MPDPACVSRRRSAGAPASRFASKYPDSALRQIRKHPGFEGIGIAWYSATPCLMCSRVRWKFCTVALCRRVIRLEQKFAHKCPKVKCPDSNCSRTGNAPRVGFKFSGFFDLRSHVALRKARLFPQSPKGRSGRRTRSKGERRWGDLATWFSLFQVTKNRNRLTEIESFNLA